MRNTYYLPHSLYAPDLYMFDDRLKRFAYRFRNAGSAETAWCSNNLGPSALRAGYGGDSIDLGGRWLVWSFSIYIADQTDATAYRMVWG